MYAETGVSRSPGMSNGGFKSLSDRQSNLADNKKPIPVRFRRWVLVRVLLAI